MADRMYPIGRLGMFWALMVASMSGCAFGGGSPEGVVRKAGEVLRDRNRAQFDDQVDPRPRLVPERHLLHLRRGPGTTTTRGIHDRSSGRCSLLFDPMIPKRR